jgi:hypothetical protein
MAEVWLEIVDEDGTASVRRVPEASREAIDLAIGQARDDARVMVRDEELSADARIVVGSHEPRCKCYDGLILDKWCKVLDTASI